jgi:MFS family permease
MLRNALPASREARRILLGTMFSAVGRGLTLPFLLIYLTQVRGLSAGTVGLLVGWMGVVALVLAPVGGSLVDRFGGRRIVLPLFAIEALGTGSLAFVDSPVKAFFSLSVVAVGFSTLWSGQNTILASLVTPEERQRAFGLSFTLLNLGIGVGGLTAGAIVNARVPATFEAIYLVDGVSYLIPAVILLGMPLVGRRIPRPARPEGESHRRGGYLEVFRDRSFVRFILFGLTVTTFGYAQIEVGFTAFSTEVAKVEPRVMGWAFAGNTILIVVAQLFVVRWLEGRSRTRALAVVGVFFAASWVVLAGAGWAGGRGLVVVAIVGVIACSVVFAMGETLLSPVMPAITNALATDELRGRYNAMGSMVFGVSGVVGPVAAGPLIGAGHASTWVVLVIAGSLLASVLALALHGRLTAEQDGRSAPVPRERVRDAEEVATV